MAKKAKKGASAHANTKHLNSNASKWPPPPEIDSSSDKDLPATAAKFLKRAEHWGTVLEFDDYVAPTQEELKGIVFATISLARKMTDSDLLVHLQRLQQQLSEVSQQVANLDHKLDHQTAAAPTPRPRSYRDALRSSTESSWVSGWLGRAQTNGTVPSNSLSASSSAPAPQRVLREDLQLIIRRTEPTLVNPLRRQEGEIVRRVNRSIQDHCANGTPVVSSGVVMHSGYVLVRCDLISDVQRLIDMDRNSTDTWCQVFGERAHLKREQYTVLMHGVRTTFDPYDKHAIARLRGQNTRRIPSNAEISHIGWLMPARKMEQLKPETSKLLIEFNDADAANQAIRLGLALDGRDHDCQYFDGSHRLQQCFHCQLYGHIARNCRREAHCAYCADTHSSEDCPHIRDRNAAKCAVCIKHEKQQINHYAFDRECPVQKEQLQIINANRLRGPQWHRPPATASPPSSNTMPTPAESSQQRQQTPPAAETAAAERERMRLVRAETRERSESPSKRTRVEVSDDDLPIRRSPSPRPRQIVTLRTPSAHAITEDTPMLDPTPAAPKAVPKTPKPAPTPVPVSTQAPLSSQSATAVIPPTLKKTCDTYDVPSSSPPKARGVRRNRSRKDESSDDELSQEAPSTQKSASTSSQQ